MFSPNATYMKYKLACAIGDIEAIEGWAGVPVEERAEALQQIITKAQAAKGVLDMRPMLVSTGTVGVRDNLQMWNEGAAAAAREKFLTESEDALVGQSNYAAERKDATDDQDGRC